MTLPFFAELRGAKRVILFGAGGGFDIFCGLPLYFALRDAGYAVLIANWTFADVRASNAREVAPGVRMVTHDTWGVAGYFPELYLSRWFKGRGEDVPIYTFDRMGAQLLRDAYRSLADLCDADAVVLIDGGTDSLMRGDESGLGTPAEDITSIAAVDLLNIPTKLLVCLGFGVDAYHGVSHGLVLEAVADLIRAAGFLGAWTLTRDMPEVRLYQEACDAAFAAMPHHPSIVSSSILSAIEGRFGDYHATARTRGSALFINPLMSMYWCFRVPQAARRVLYMDRLKATRTIQDVAAVLRTVHDTMEGQRPPITIPL